MTGQQELIKELKIVLTQDEKEILKNAHDILKDFQVRMCDVYLESIESLNLKQGAEEFADFYTVYSDRLYNFQVLLELMYSTDVFYKREVTI